MAVHVGTSCTWNKIFIPRQRRFPMIKWLIQSTRSEKSEAGGGRRALEILEERYARGEIDKAEFEEKRKDLT